MTKVVTEILNLNGPGEHWSNEKELVFWDGLGSILVAETLRALLHPFEQSDITVKIRRDEYKPFVFNDFPSAQYMNWQLNAYADGAPVVVGYIMAHKAFPESETRTSIRYTLTGAKKRQSCVRKTASR